MRIAGLLGLACSLATVSFLAGFEATARRYELTTHGRSREEGLRAIRGRVQYARESVAREEARALALAEWLLAVVDPEVPLRREREGRLPSFYRLPFLPRQEMGVWSAVVVLRASEGMGRPWMSRMATASGMDPDSQAAMENWIVELIRKPDEAVSMMKLGTGESEWRISQGRLWWLARAPEGESGHLVLAIAKASPIPASLTGWLWSNAPQTPLRLDSFGGSSRIEQDAALFPRTDRVDASLAEGVREDESGADGMLRIRGLSSVSRGARWLVSWELELPRRSGWYREASSLVHLLLKAFAGLGGASLLLLAWLEWGMRGRDSRIATAKIHAPPSEPSVVSDPKEEEPRTERIHGDRSEAVLLHVRIRELQQWLADRELEIDGVHEARQWTADAVRLRAKENGGRAIPSSEGGYLVLFWSGEESASAESAALKTALSLRSDLVTLNAARKNEGARVVHFEMGLHRGLVFRPSGDSNESWGPAMDAVRGLSECAGVLGRDLAIGAGAASRLEAFAELVQIGDAKIHGEVDEAAIFTAKGLKGSVPEQPGEFESFDVRTTAWSFGATLRESRWWVDNGSRLLGPLSVAELGRLLVSQELDFDSICWNSERGEKLPLGQAKVFGSASPDGEHRFWLHDGKQLHGPLNAPFLRNSHERGWVPETALVCEGSTVQGWRPLGRWIANSTVEAETAPVTASTAAPRDPGSEAA